MKVIDHIQKAKGETLFSLEVLPPLKGQHISRIFETIDPLMEFKPPFIDVTYHREEYVFKKHPNNLLEKKIVRKRPGTVGICTAIQHRYHVDAVPHVLCGGFNKEETENFLIDLQFLGIENVLALRGDHVKSETHFRPEEDGHVYAIGLVKQIGAMNHGMYLDEELANTSPTNFCIGVAGYPEKHIEAPSMESDIHFLKKKIESGASYVVTQMFFDNQKYFDFVKNCRKAGITVPIVPGLKPLTLKRHLNFLPKFFKIDLPDALVKEVIKCKTKEQIGQVGVDWCIAQSKELIKEGAPVLHFYSMGKSNKVYRVAKELF